jgi:hypothetical protein
VKLKKGRNRPGHVYAWVFWPTYESWRWKLPHWLRFEMPWTYLKRVVKHERDRVNHGYSWNDWISFDTYICQVIADAVQDFRLHGAGYPMGMDEAEWHDILHKIEDPLRWWATEKFDNNLDAKGEIQKYKEAQAAMALFAEHLGSMWD